MAVGFETFVSLRYLFTNRWQSFISLVTMVSIAGVAVGVMALIVVLAVMNGFQHDLRERILGVTSHIIIGRYGETIADYKTVAHAAEEIDGVVAATPFVYTQVMLSSARGVSGAVLRGVDPVSAPRVTGIGKNLIAGNLDALSTEAEPGDSEHQPGIILGAELKRHLGVNIRDWVKVISPSGRLTPMGRIPKSKLFRVTGVFQSGMYEYDNTLAYISLNEAQNFLGIGDTATGIELRVSDIYQADEISRKLQASLGYPFWVRDWMQMNRNLFSALKLEKVVMFIILTLIILVAAFNIISSLFMMVMEKTRDIAILKAMGATRDSIRKIFMLEGFFIGVVGTALGLAGGFILCGLLDRYEFIKLPSEVYYISTLPVRMQTLDVVLIAASAIIISFLATIYPSRRAALMEPAEALRFE